ncbi:acyltransferase family protein [Planktothrix mougeotii]|uniref:Acyltransferase n=1 Tax=Planktothrix mougeotii LEGE 06226 TaxID=1828728 RepID=A0ABR9UAR8_9CYAN|nr:acyltransferase family protein [Planktothrix mougeotii]MBE9143527.1 acyltransferase [Planktothrix mougeotii LEGE 06226]
MNKIRPQQDVLELTDFCKGLAIAWIVLVHLKGYWFGWQGIHIFVILSGFGLSYSCYKKQSALNWKKWFNRRFRRLLPVYWFAVLLSFPLLAYLTSVKFALVRTILDTLLLTNFFESFQGGPTGAFWYVPFIIGFYLAFPILYQALQKSPTLRSYSLILLATLGIEFIYRGISIYYLDGLPTAHDHKFFGFIPDPVSVLELQEDKFFGLLQARSPFSFLPARIAEFTLGMIAGLTLIQSPQKFNQIILNPLTGWLGFCIWLLGQTLLYIGLWGWIFSDFVITVGLILWTINLAAFVQSRIPLAFQGLTFLGIWSYYIYLSHQPLTRLYPEFETLWLSLGLNIFPTFIVQLIYLTLFIISVILASRLLWKFDQSPIPEQMTQQLSNFLNKLRLSLRGF